MKNVSISIRLTFWLSAIFMGSSVLFGVGMWLDLGYHLSQGRDRTLTRRSTRFVDLLEATRTEPAPTRQVKLEQLADVIPEGNLIQIFEASGARLFPMSPSPSDFPWPALSAVTRDEYSDLTYGERTFRLFKHPAQVDRLLIVMVAGQLEDNRNLMARFTTGLATAIPAMLMLSALAGYFLSRRVLQPVDQIAAAVRSISIGNLSQRLPLSGTGDELQRLAQACNDMLARLEDAVERINRFTADASHELRSPVALIRTVAEYALRKPHIDTDSKEAFQEILAEAVDTGLLLEDLLTLARADAGYADSVFEPVDLAELVRDVCAKMRPLADGKEQTVAVRTTSGAAWINGDRSSLRRLISILLDNAVKYTPAHGRIEVAMQVVDTHAVITVRDSGIGIPEVLLPRIFDRFVRADPSRGEVNGTGLGLAIAKWIAGAHHAALTVRSKEQEGSVFSVEFPLAESAAAPVE